LSCDGNCRSRDQLLTSRGTIQRNGCYMDGLQDARFDPAKYLASSGTGRKLSRYKSKKLLYSQGGPADSVFYIHSGRAKLTVVSRSGKEATVTLLAGGDFVGEESLDATALVRTATARTITDCIAIRIASIEMQRVLREEKSFAELFLKFILAKSVRTQADLVDQLFNSSERRLARILLLMADYGMPGEPTVLIPHVTQETLAEMIGSTRSRVSFFMNRFRRLGYIAYKGRIRVNKSLLNVVLHDQLPEENSARPALLDTRNASASKRKVTKE
jgi:CRP/FNR family transcriptional regulator, cyclic AMP receptor protein